MSTGPPAKIARFGDDFPQIDRNGNGKAIEFFVILCADVLLEVLCWADRRRLTKLERIGRRFHWGVVKFFREKPFFRLSCELRTRKRCQCYIPSNNEGYCRQRQIFKRELTNLPQFLRFDRVDLHYQSSVYAYALPTAKMCQTIVNYLQLLKLNDTNLIHFNGAIDQNDCNKFLDHLRNELLPICGSNFGFKFSINLLSDVFSRTELIAQILQIPRIECCSNVEIGLPKRFEMYLTQLPIEPISNWLHRNCDGSEKKPKERFLRISSFDSNNSTCVRELSDHLKKVFVGAKCRVCPFTLKLDYGIGITADDDDEEKEKEIMINENTNEELLIVKKQLFWNNEKLIKIIKRGAQKKN